MTLCELAEETIANPSLNKSELKQNGKKTLLLCTGVQRNDYCISVKNSIFLLYVFAMFA